MPTLEEHLTPKQYVDQVFSNIVDESSFLRLDPDEKLKLHEKSSIFVNSTLISAKTIQELPTKPYAAKKIFEPRIIKNTSHVDFNVKNLDNVRFVKVNSMPAVGEHLTAKYYVDKAIFIV